MINSATCNAVASRGCSAPVALIRLQGVVQALALDQRAGVLYADMLAAPRHQPSASTWRRVAVISTRACNASVTTGCETAATVPLGQVLYAAIAVDQATGTVYAAGPSRLAIISGRACATRKTSGCAKVLATIPAYGYITGIAADAGMVYVTSPGTGTVTMLRASACGAVTTTGCARQTLIRAGPDPLAAIPDPSAHTLYVTDNAASAVSMVDPAACGRVAADGCPPFAPAFPVGFAPGDAAVDTATGTLFVGNLGSRSVSLISTTTCNAALGRGCPARSPAGTPAIRHTAYTCDPAVAAYQSGQPAGPFLPASVRVADGTTGGEAWSVWAKKGVFDPNGIEQGGLVLGGRWYALCSAPLSAAADAASIELIDTPGHGTVYGYVQYPQRVTITLTAPGPLPHPTLVALHGITFFIEKLPRAACGYHTLTLHGQAPGWAAITTLTLGRCEPGDLTDVLSSDGTEGPARPGSGH